MPDLLRQIPITLDQIRTQSNVEYSKPIPFCSRNITWINAAYVDANRYISNHHHDNFLGKGAVAVGYLVATKLNGMIAVVEFLASAVLTGLGFIICAATNNQNTLLMSHTVSLCSYASESLLSMVILSFDVKPDSHIQNSIISQCRRVLSMVITRLVFHSVINPPQRECDNIICRRLGCTIRIVLEDFLNDLKSEAFEDLAQSSFLQRATVVDRDRVIQKILAIRAQLNQFSTPEYVNNLTNEQFTDILEVLGLVSGMTLANFNEPIHFEPVRNNRVSNESEYKQHLAQVIENAVAAVYRDPELVSILADEEEGEDPVLSGRNAIREFSSNIYLPLANYAQLCELQGEIQCPSGILNGNRRRNLMVAKQALNTLDARSVSLLKKRLLGKELTAEDQQGVSSSQIAIIESLYRSIPELASDLHRGPLASATNVSWADGVSRVNLFHGALQRALANI
ncbi:MAG: hypothetical protein FJZ57_05470 [Chlamydiae bacterium]|nr:hypothetical protein [Chlamydiota bacterium]